MTGLIAGLPMYDWAEVRVATDAVWSAISNRFNACGVDAPSRLSRDLSLDDLWLSPKLLLAQTCGYPFVSRLQGRVTLIGAPDFGVPGCPPGWYCSAIVVRKDDPRVALSEFSGATVAINGPDSQSGAMALMATVAGSGGGAGFYGSIVRSAAHLRSIEMVARHQADIAAIDFVSWRLAVKHNANANNLRVLMTTEPMPGLPYITVPTLGAEEVAEVVTLGFDDVSDSVRDVLGIKGFVSMLPADYDVIAERAHWAKSVAPLPWYSSN